MFLRVIGERVEFLLHVVAVHLHHDLVEPVPQAAHRIGFEPPSDVVRVHVRIVGVCGQYDYRTVSAGFDLRAEERGFHGGRELVNLVIAVEDGRVLEVGVKFIHVHDALFPYPNLQAARPELAISS